MRNVLAFAAIDRAPAPSALPTQPAAIIAFPAEQVRQHNATKCDRCTNFAGLDESEAGRLIRLRRCMACAYPGLFALDATGQQ